MKHYISLLDETGTVAVDDTILMKEAEATAGSRILKGYKPLFDAEVVGRLQKNGYIISGKTNVGEFGLDLMGEFSFFGASFSEVKKTIAGAAADLIAAKKIRAALNVDLNGAPRRAASVSGIDFIKPTYGTVSRYGIIPCACSGEQVGVSAENAETAAEILTVIAGHDGKDGTSLPEKQYQYSVDRNITGLRLCTVQELSDAASDETRNQLNSFLEKLRGSGVAVDEVSFDFIHAAQIAWQILLAAETCNNLSRYDGVKFGYRTPTYKNIDDLYVNTRTEGFNFLTKAIILYGSDVLSKNRYDSCYDKSLRIRRAVSEKMRDVFQKYDAVLMPACAKTHYPVYNMDEAFLTVFKESAFTAIPSLTGLPCMVTGGVQMTAPAFGESILLSIAHHTEKMS